MQQLKLRCFFSCGRLYSFSPSSSLNQPAMKTISSLPGLRGSAGSLPWPQSSGFLWVPFTHCGCYLAHSCRWRTFTIYLFPPQDITVTISWAYKIKQWVIITGTFFPQKLKLSITPYALNEMSKKAYYERGGNREDGYPAIAAISSTIPLPDKPPIQTYFWYLCALHN